MVRRSRPQLYARVAALARSPWTLQGLWWLAFAGIYYAALHPFALFPDLLVARVAIATVLGFGLSTGFWFGHRLLLQRGVLFSVVLPVVLVGSVLAGLGWYYATEVLAGTLNPFEGSIAYISSPLASIAPSPLDRPETFAAVLFVWNYVAIVYRERQRVQEERLLQANALAREAELKMLRYQLNPHFLFNALNSIAALADEAPDRVGPMVRELSGFLRYSLLHPDAPEVPLGREVAAAEHYLSVERVRFEDDLVVEVDVAPEAAAFGVPAFFVLPLVENAIKYGQRTSPMPLRVRLCASRPSNGRLRLEVANTGRWLDGEHPAAGTGTGLDNVRRRLQQHFPGRHRFLHVEDEGWVRVIVEVDG